MYTSVTILHCRSESPSQVLLIVLSWLYQTLQSIPQSEWSSVVIAYDNMCHLDSLRALAEPLPLPKPYDTMWTSITKVCYYGCCLHSPMPRLYFFMHSRYYVFSLVFFVLQVIDDLHFRNHTDVECRKKYDPKVVRKEHPHYNFMIAEQTFAWLSRFKKILCSMDKQHHIFFLHRLVVRRNIYAQVCMAEGRRMLLPKVNKQFFVW